MSEARATETELDDLLATAEELARGAGEITLQYFGGRVAAEAKADGTPVTRADREAEAALRAGILSRYPGHGVLGEEHGETNPGARVRWIVDPIDGTRSFIRGVPLYGVLIGIEIDGEPAVGVAHFPALGETVAAARGRGCAWNGQPARVSSVDRLEDALLLTTDPQAIASSPYARGFASLQTAARYSRSWGDAYGHALVATGRAEVMVDPILSDWDAAPLLTIVTEAGGRYTTAGGDASIRGGSGVSTNGILHARVIAQLSGG